MADRQPDWQRIKIVAVLTTLAGIVGGGTVFFHLVEGWGWVDSYFFTVVTLSTVGYGNITPETTLGKLGTTGFIFAGLGVFAYAIQLFGAMAVRRQERKLARKQDPDARLPDDRDQFR